MIRSQDAEESCLTVLNASSIHRANRSCNSKQWTWLNRASRYRVTRLVKFYPQDKRPTAWSSVQSRSLFWITRSICAMNIASITVKHDSSAPCAHAFFEKRAGELCNCLVCRGYNRDFVEKEIERAGRIPRVETLSNKQSAGNERIPVVVTFHPYIYIYQYIYIYIYIYQSFLTNWRHGIKRIFKWRKRYSSFYRFHLDTRKNANVSQTFSS